MNPRTVTLGPLPDGPYTVTWIETFGAGSALGEQYSGLFTLVGGALLDPSVSIPATAWSGLLILSLLLSLAARQRLKSLAE